MQVLVVTSEKYYKCLPGFIIQWLRYTGIENQTELNLLICGYSPPEFYPYRELIPFYSIGDQADYPVGKWSDALIKILDTVAEEQFILMLEDYWLYRRADLVAVRMLFDYAVQFQNVLKIDLAFDRLYIEGGSRFLFGANSYDYCGYVDLIKSPHETPYQMSLWGGIWNREQMKKVIIPGETAQDVEINGTRRVTEDQLVLGTRQAPMPHCNIYQSRNGGKPAYADTSWKISPEDLQFLRDQGWAE